MRSILLDVVIVGVPEGDVDGAVLARGEGGGGDGDLGVVQFRIAGYDGDFEFAVGAAHGVEHVAVRSRLRHTHCVDARLGELVRARVRAVVGGGVVSHGFLALLRVVVGYSRDVELVRARILRDDVAVRVQRDHREAHLSVGDDSTVLNRAAAEQQRLFRGRFRHRDVGVVNAHVNRREINRVVAARHRVAGVVGDAQLRAADLRRDGVLSRAGQGGVRFVAKAGSRPLEIARDLSDDEIAAAAAVAVLILELN